MSEFAIGMGCGFGGGISVPNSFADIYAFDGDFDASALADGAATSWPNKGVAGGALAGTCTISQVLGPNGCKAAVFNGSSDVMSGGTSVKGSSVMATHAVTLFAVVFINSIGTDSATSYLNDAVVSVGGEYAGLHLRSTGPTLQCYTWDGADKKATATTALGRWLLLQLRLDATKVYARSEADAETEALSGGIVDLTGPFRLGANYTTAFADIRIARVLSAKANLSAPTTAAVRSRLSARYGVAA